MIYRLSKEFRFESSHQLVHHDGKCARLHGHSWIGEIFVEGRQLKKQGPKTNMVVDYGDIGEACKFLESALDHQHLNDVLQNDSPTSEFIARWCFDAVANNFPDLEITAIEISETCTTSCRYEP